MAELQESHAAIYAISIAAIVSVVAMVLFQGTSFSYSSSPVDAPAGQNVGGAATSCSIVRETGGFRTAYCGGVLQWSCGPCTSGTMTCASFGDTWTRAC